MTPDDLRSLDRDVALRIVAKGGEEIRGMVGPGDVSDGKIRCSLFHQPPDSWTVRYGGWPAVYTAGKYRRWDLEGETVEVPLEQVEGLRVERYSWGLTFLSLPLTLPVGIVDLLVHHAQFGFDDQGGQTRTDGFGSPPPGGRPAMGSIQLEKPELPPAAPGE